MDALLIEQVLINLFDNVSAHAGGATGIWLDIRENAREVEMTVEDDGEGLKKELMPSLFSGSGPAGRQADGRRNMGIGLSVCRAIVRAHGGEMTAGSSRRGGAAFTFTLPKEERK